MRRLVLSLVCVLPLACGDADGTASATTNAAAVVKSPGPSVEVVDLAGLDAALAKHRGRGVLLNFWALWCAPCVAELPELMEVAHEFADDGGDVVLVSYDLIIPGAKLDEARHDVTEFARKRSIDVPILIYDAPDYEAINARYRLPGGVPMTLALDAKGEIVEVHDGAADKARFEELMRKALGR
ncbi:MAG: TlpA family protein disulfide reductase [Planctomycetes bacterium]|nr:TlpA family protein disulfide reductase [Planctomycetota bacterium]